MKRNYNKIIVIFILVLIGLSIYWGLLEAEIIRNYKIKEFYIDATIREDGDMSVKEDTLYRFNGKYNGITITIPSSVSKEYYESMTKDSINDSETLPDSLYISSGIKDVNIYVEENGEKRLFNQVGAASIGDTGVYTVSNESENVTYTIYEPSKNEKKRIIIEYTLQNVAVKHNDLGEIYWNFIGGNVECNISKLNININILKDSFLKTYTHGNASGKTEEINNQNVNFSYRNVKAGQYVSARLLFGKNAIGEAIKRSNVSALDLIIDQEQSYIEKSNIRKALNVIAIIAIIGIFVYWVYLLIKYERDKFIPMANIDDIEMMNKYNPMILACIAQNRDMHPRDIIAVLIDLVNIGALKMNFSKKENKIKSAGTYILTKNKDFFDDPNKYSKLDEIQNEILYMFFDKEDQIELLGKLKKINKKDSMVNKLKKLDRIAAVKLEEVGANLKSVPVITLIINNCIFILVVFYLLAMISYNVVLNMSMLSTSNHQIIGSAVEFGVIIIIAISALLPYFLRLILAILGLINSVKRSISKLSFKLTSKKLTKMILDILIIFILIIVFEIFVINQSYMIIATILFFEILMLILTDNLMTSHENKIKKDYFRLKMIQDRIEKGSLLDEKEFSHNVLWEKYLTFAIALGVGEVSKYVALIPEYNNLNDALEDINYFTSDYYDIYNSERDVVSRNKINKYKSTISEYERSRSSGSGSSFGGGSSSFGGGGSSFGGGGFSGGGRRRWR